MEFGITDADRNLLVSSLSFDLTQKNLYAPLISGGQLHLAVHGAGVVVMVRAHHVERRIVHDHGLRGSKVEPPGRGLPCIG